MSGRQLTFVVPGSLERRTGGSIYDRRMVEGLRRRGWSVAVVELVARSPADDRPPRSELAESLAALADGALVVLDFLAAAEAPAVLRAHDTRLTMIALVHLLPADEPLLEPAERDRRRRLEHAALGACRGAIATSRYTAARLGELGLTSDEIRIVIPGTDPAPRAVGPGPEAPPQILCLAAVTPGKGQAVLVRVLAELAALPWTCVCAGSLTRDPVYVERLERSIGEAGLSARMILPGECDVTAVEELYRSSSIFVLPSYFESYGMVLAEAMARGLPIVSTTAGAIPATVPADAGVLSPPGDSGALVHALRRLLEDPPDTPGQAQCVREAIGTAGYRHAATLPDWDCQVDRFSASLSAFADRAG